MTLKRNIYKTGRLTVKPAKPSAQEEARAGLQSLKLGGSRDGFLYVPKNYQKGQHPALAVMLHGAGGEAEHGLALLKAYADIHNILLLAPASRDRSWDIIAADAFDLDVIFIDQALEMIFDRFAIDPTRLAIGGFSDGASYALSLGLSNGDLFTHILAFSPGFVFTIEKIGKPAIFISHGDKDSVLSIEHCSRRIVPQLKRQGYDVNYHEFNGGHEIPAPISKSGVSWFLAG